MGKDLIINIFIIFLLTFFAYPAYSENISRQNVADNLFLYAKHCMDSGDFDCASREFDRFLFLFPADSRVNEATLYHGQALLAAGDVARSIEVFEQLIQTCNGCTQSIEAFFSMSKAYMKLGDYQEACRILDTLIHSSIADSGINDRAYASIGWLKLKEGDFSGAKAAFDMVGTQGRSKYGIDKIVKAMVNPEHNPITAPPKDPVTAGILGVVPGGGYMYCGQKQDALTAFIVCSLLFAAAYESFNHGLEANGGLFSMIGIGFYGGSIWGGIAAAHRYNKRAYESYIRNIEERVPRDPLVSLSKSEHWGVGFTISFRF